MNTIDTQGSILDITKEHLLTMRHLFETGKIRSVDEIIPVLMKLHNISIPDGLVNIFASYTTQADRSLDWNKYLSILEEETKISDRQKYDTMYGYKKVFLQKHQSNPNVSALTHDIYSVSYYYRIPGLDLSIVIINKSHMILANNKLNKVYDNRYFYRHYLSFNQYKLSNILKRGTLDKKGKSGGFGKIVGRVNSKSSEMIREEGLKKDRRMKVWGDEKRFRGKSSIINIIEDESTAGYFGLKNSQGLNESVEKKGLGRGNEKIKSINILNLSGFSSKHLTIDNDEDMISLIQTKSKLRLANPIKRIFKHQRSSSYNQDQPVSLLQKAPSPETRSQRNRFSKSRFSSSQNVNESTGFNDTKISEEPKIRNEFIDSIENINVDDMKSILDEDIRRLYSKRIHNKLESFKTNVSKLKRFNESVTDVLEYQRKDKEKRAGVLKDSRERINNIVYCKPEDEFEGILAQERAGKKGRFGERSRRRNLMEGTGLAMEVERFREMSLDSEDEIREKARKEKRALPLEDMNYREKPRTGMQCISSNCAYYWDKEAVLIVGFLNRELITYVVDKDKSGPPEIVRVEDIAMEGMCTNLSIEKSSYESQAYFLMMEVDLIEVHIYKLTQTTFNPSFLSKNITRKNLVFKQSFGGSPRIQFVADGFIVNSEKVAIRLFVQSSDSSFSQTLKLTLYQKFSPTTISSMDYSKKFSVLLVGSAQGDLFVYDSDIKSVVFKYKQQSEKLIKVKVCEMLKCVYIFYERGGIKVFDLMTYQLMQDLETPLFWSINSWVSFPSIDQDRVAKDPEMPDYIEERRQAAHTERKVKSGAYSVFVGLTAITEHKFYVEADREFAELASDLRAKGRGEEERGAGGLSSTMLDGMTSWRHCCMHPVEHTVLLVDDRKLLVNYDYNNRLIINYAMLDIKGELTTFELVNSASQLLVADASGEASLYNVQPLVKVATYSIDLQCVLKCVGVFNGLVDFVFVGMPNEVFCVRSSNQQKAMHVLERYDREQVLGFQLDAAVLEVFTDKDNL